MDNYKFINNHNLKKTALAVLQWLIIKKRDTVIPPNPIHGWIQSMSNSDLLLSISSLSGCKQRTYRLKEKNSDNGRRSTFCHAARLVCWRAAKATAADRCVQRQYLTFTCSGAAWHEYSRRGGGGGARFASLQATLPYTHLPCLNVLVWVPAMDVSISYCTVLSVEKCRIFDLNHFMIEAHRFYSLKCIY